VALIVSALSGRLPLRPYPPSHLVSLRVAVVEKRSTNYLGQKADRSWSGRVNLSPLRSNRAA
jgi:hypothetical protein